MAETGRMLVDDLYVVSDLHLGGEPGRQIFNQGKRLAALIRRIAGSDLERRRVLVINGDIFDFLLEAPRGQYLNPARAISALEDLARDGDVADVFNALSELVHTERCRLVLAIGNHDIELALPPVRRWLADRLCREDPAALGRLELATDGTGFTCLVGTRRVLCVHGNEVDAWNWVDHEALRRAARRHNRGRNPQPWESNAGTRLVVDFLNDIKRERPFVDLLKPERDLAIPLLLALDPQVVAQLRRAAPMLRALAAGRGQTTGTLSAPSAALAVAPYDDEMLAGSRYGSDRTRMTEVSDAELEQLFRSGHKPRDVMWDEGAPDSLGLVNYVVDRVVRRRTRQEALRDALGDWIVGDHSFDWQHPDDDFRALDATTDASVDFLVAGHTHLRRSLRRGYGHYFNSGTWSRLIQVNRAMLDDDQNYDVLYRCLMSRSLTDLDREEYHEIVKVYPTVVKIAAAEGHTKGWLAEVTDTGDCTPIQGSEAER